MNKFYPIFQCLKNSVPIISGLCIMLSGSVWAQNTPFYQVEKLEATVNSDYDEIAPRFSADGKTLYFTRAEHPENIGGKKGGTDAWASQRLSGGWAAAQNMGAPINNIGHNGVVGQNEKGVLILNNVYHTNGNMTDGVSVSSFENGVWAEPDETPIEQFSNKSEFSSYFVRNNFLICEMQGADSYGEQDLYVCFKNDKEGWTAPVNLGKIINTTGNEISPFLTADEKTLYFAADKSGGFGDFDIYVTHRLDNTWQKWTEPENLGAPVNTPFFEAYFVLSPDEQEAFFVSRNHKGKNADIFRAKHYPAALREQNNILVMGQIVNEDTDTPINARIQFDDMETQQMVAERKVGLPKSDFQVELPANKDYGYYITADGYIPLYEFLDKPSVDGVLKIERKIRMVTNREGATIGLVDIFFDYNLPEFRPEFVPTLNKIVAYLRDNPTLKIEIRGHTDNMGDPVYNQKLSEERAKNIYEYFLKEKIEPQRMVTRGFGDAAPAAPNDTEDGRKLNRRVEFSFIE